MSSDPYAALPDAAPNYDGIIQNAAKKKHIDPALLRAVGMQETGLGTSKNYNPRTGLDYDGNQGHGLFQLDPASGASQADLDRAARDPAFAAEYAAGMLAKDLAAYHGNRDEALAAYNAGSPTAQGMAYAKQVERFLPQPAPAPGPRRVEMVERKHHGKGLQLLGDRVSNGGDDPYAALPAAADPYAALPAATPTPTTTPSQKRTGPAPQAQVPATVSRTRTVTPHGGGKAVSPPTLTTPLIPHADLVAQEAAFKQAHPLLAPWARTILLNNLQQKAFLNTPYMRAEKWAADHLTPIAAGKWLLRELGGTPLGQSGVRLTDQLGAQAGNLMALGGAMLRDLGHLDHAVASGQKSVAQPGETAAWGDRIGKALMAPWGQKLDALQEAAQENMARNYPFVVGPGTLANDAYHATAPYPALHKPLAEFIRHRTIRKPLEFAANVGMGGLEAKALGAAGKLMARPLERSAMIQRGLSQAADIKERVANNLGFGKYYDLRHEARQVARERGIDPEAHAEKVQAAVQGGQGFAQMQYVKGVRRAAEAYHGLDFAEQRDATIGYQTAEYRQAYEAVKPEERHEIEYIQDLYKQADMAAQASKNAEATALREKAYALLKDPARDPADQALLEDHLQWLRNAQEGEAYLQSLPEERRAKIAPAIPKIRAAIKDLEAEILPAFPGIRPHVGYFNTRGAWNPIGKESSVLVGGQPLSSKMFEPSKTYPTLLRGISSGRELHVAPADLLARDYADKYSVLASRKVAQRLQDLGLIRDVQYKDPVTGAPLQVEVAGPVKPGQARATVNAEGPAGAKAALRARMAQAMTAAYEQLARENPAAARNLPSRQAPTPSQWNILQGKFAGLKAERLKKYYLQAAQQAERVAGITSKRTKELAHSALGDTLGALSRVETTARSFDLPQRSGMNGWKAAKLAEDAAHQADLAGDFQAAEELRAQATQFRDEARAGDTAQRATPAAPAKEPTPAEATQAEVKAAQAIPTAVEGTPEEPTPEDVARQGRAHQAEAKARRKAKAESKYPEPARPGPLAAAQTAEESGYKPFETTNGRVTVTRFQRSDTPEYSDERGATYYSKGTPKYTGYTHVTQRVNPDGSIEPLSPEELQEENEGAGGPVGGTRRFSGEIPYKKALHVENAENDLSHFGVLRHFGLADDNEIDYAKVRAYAKRLFPGQPLPEGHYRMADKVAAELARREGYDVIIGEGGDIPEVVALYPPEHYAGHSVREVPPDTPKEVAPPQQPSATSLERKAEIRDQVAQLNRDLEEVQRKRMAGRAKPEDLADLAQQQRGIERQIKALTEEYNAAPEVEEHKPSGLIFTPAGGYKRVMVGTRGEAFDAKGNEIKDARYSARLQEGGLYHVVGKTGKGGKWYVARDEDLHPLKGVKKDATFAEAQAVAKKSEPAPPVKEPVQEHQAAAAPTTPPADEPPTETPEETAQETRAQNARRSSGPTPYRRGQAAAAGKVEETIGEQKQQAYTTFEKRKAQAAEAAAPASKVAARHKASADRQQKLIDEKKAKVAAQVARRDLAATARAEAAKVRSALLKSNEFNPSQYEAIPEDYKPLRNVLSPELKEGVEPGKMVSQAVAEFFRGMAEEEGRNLSETPAVYAPAFRSIVRRTITTNPFYHGFINIYTNALAGGMTRSAWARDAWDYFIPRKGRHERIEQFRADHAQSIADLTEDGGLYGMGTLGRFALHPTGAPKEMTHVGAAGLRSIPASGFDNLPGKVLLEKWGEALGDKTTAYTFDDMEVVAAVRLYERYLGEGMSKEHAALETRRVLGDYGNVRKDTSTENMLNRMFLFYPWLKTRVKMLPRYLSPRVWQPVEMTANSSALAGQQPRKTTSGPIAGELDLSRFGLGDRTFTVGTPLSILNIAGALATGTDTEEKGRPLANLLMGNLDPTLQIGAKGALTFLGGDKVPDYDRLFDPQDPRGLAGAAGSLGAHVFQDLMPVENIEKGMENGPLALPAAALSTMGVHIQDADTSAQTTQRLSKNDIEKQIQYLDIAMRQTSDAGMLTLLHRQRAMLEQQLMGVQP